MYGLALPTYLSPARETSTRGQSRGAGAALPSKASSLPPPSPSKTSKYSPSKLDRLPDSSILEDVAEDHPADSRYTTDAKSSKKTSDASASPVTEHHILKWPLDPDRYPDKVMIYQHNKVYVTNDTYTDPTIEKNLALRYQIDEHRDLAVLRKYEAVKAKQAELKEKKAKRFNDMLAFINKQESVFSDLENRINNLNVKKTANLDNSMSSSVGRESLKSKSVRFAQ